MQQHVIFKESNMIMCVLLVSNSRGCCLAAPGDHEGAATIFSTATNILSIKSNLKFESRTTAVFVAMSPRYLGGKYRSRLHPPRRTSFCGRLSVWNRTVPDRRHLLPVATTKWPCGVFKSWISDAHCPLQSKWRVLYNYDVSVLQQVGMFFNGIACFIQAGVPSCLDDLTLHLCANF